jgi:hypothetical protein
MRLTRSIGGNLADLGSHDHHQSADYYDDVDSAALHHIDDDVDHDDVKHERAGGLKLITPGRPQTTAGCAIDRQATLATRPGAVYLRLRGSRLRAEGNGL